MRLQRYMVELWSTDLNADSVLQRLLDALDPEVFTEVSDVTYDGAPISRPKLITGKKHEAEGYE